MVIQSPLFSVGSQAVLTDVDEVCVVECSRIRTEVPSVEPVARLSQTKLDLFDRPHFGGLLMLLDLLLIHSLVLIVLKVAVLSI